MGEFIVAEITKNWTGQVNTEPLLSQKFERVIATNEQRGYSLHDWKLTSCVYNGVITETIIAIFKLVKNE